MRKDMQAIRAFIAIELPKVTQEALADVQARLNEQIPPGSVRWVKSHNMHLTLKFLGQVPMAQLDTISAALSYAVSSLREFSFDVMGAGCFPNERRPRVIWIGIDEPGGVLNGLHRSIESVIEPLGYPTESRSYQPHLTLGRAARDVKPVDLHRMGEATVHAKIGLIGHIHVNDIVLFQSDLTPKGPVYTVLKRFPLAR